MSDDDVQTRRLQEIAEQLPREFGVIHRVDVDRYTDSTGDDAVRLLLILTDPSEGGTYPYDALEPMVNKVYDMAADLGLMVYVRFRLVSEDREIEAGTYFT